VKPKETKYFLVSLLTLPPQETKIWGNVGPLLFPSAIYTLLEKGLSSFSNVFLIGHIFATRRSSSEVFQSCKNLLRFFRLEITPNNP
jgi:hypothetical protein